MDHVDVVIVGAGFAGLSAAKYLSSKPIKYLIVEGRSRVGGRSLSQQINNQKLTIDLGGQWIGPSQKRILSFIKEFNFQLIEQTWPNHNPNHLGEAIGLIPLNNYQIEQINQINFEWDQMSLQLPDVEHALSYQKSSQWSQISLQQFIEEHPSKFDLRVQQELKLQILTLTGKVVFFLKHEPKGSVEVQGQKFGPTTDVTDIVLNDLIDIVLNDLIEVTEIVVMASQTMTEISCFTF